MEEKRVVEWVVEWVVSPLAVSANYRESIYSEYIERVSDKDCVLGESTKQLALGLCGN